MVRIHSPRPEFFLHFETDTAVGEFGLPPQCPQMYSYLQLAARDDPWRRLAAKRFSFNESVSSDDSTLCSSSAPTAIADIVIAATGAAQTPVDKPGRR